MYFENNQTQGKLIKGISQKYSHSRQSTCNFLIKMKYRTYKRSSQIFNIKNIEDVGNKPNK